MGADELTSAEVANLMRSAEPVAGQAAGLRLANMAASKPPMFRFDAGCADRLGPALQAALFCAARRRGAQLWHGTVGIVAQSA